MTDNEQPAWAVAMERRLRDSINGSEDSLQGDLASLRRDVLARLSELKAAIMQAGKPLAAREKLLERLDRLQRDLDAWNAKR